MSVRSVNGNGCRNSSGLASGDQSAALFSMTCTGSCDAGSIPAAGVGCIGTQPTSEPTTMTEIEALKERVDRLEAEREQEQRPVLRRARDLRRLGDRRAAPGRAPGAAPAAGR